MHADLHVAHAFSEHEYEDFKYYYASSHGNMVELSAPCNMVEHVMQRLCVGGWWEQDHFTLKQSMSLCYNLCMCVNTFLLGAKLTQMRLLPSMVEHLYS